MRRLAPLLLAAALTAGCTTVHPAAPAAPPAAPAARPAAAAHGDSGPGTPLPAPPPSPPRLVDTGPFPSTGRPAPPAPAPPRRRHRPPVVMRRPVPAGRSARQGAALCREGVRLRRLPPSWAGLCRAALGG